MAILEIPSHEDKPNVELVINSILSFMCKCINDSLSSKKNVEMLIDHYSERKLKQAWSLIRSLLEKKDRPKRKHINYDNSTKDMKIILVAKQIVKMVKSANKSKNIVLASSKLNLPMIYNTPNDHIENNFDDKSSNKIQSQSVNNSINNSNSAQNSLVNSDCQMRQNPNTTIFDNIDCDLTCCTAAHISGVKCDSSISHRKDANNDLVPQINAPSSVTHVVSETCLQKQHQNVCHHCKHCTTQHHLSNQPMSTGAVSLPPEVLATLKAIQTNS